MNNRRLTLIILLVVSVLAVFFARQLLGSTEFATFVFVLLYVVILAFLSPFVGLIVYLGFFYIRPHDFLPGFIGMPINLVVGAGALAAFLLHSAVRDRKIGLVKAPQNYLLLWFVIALGASRLAHMDMSGAVDAIYSYFGAAVTFLLIANTVTDGAKLRKLLHAIALLTLVAALPGIAIRLFHIPFIEDDPVLAEQWKFQTGGERIEGLGIFGDPNELAATLLLVLPFLYALLRTSRIGLVKMYALVSMIVLSCGIYLTNSRGGVLGFGGLAAILLARRLGVAAGTVIGGLLIVLLTVFGPSRMHTISTSDASAMGRVEAWGAGLAMFEANPVFGVGKTQFVAHYVRAAHNSFVNCAAELGLFGLIPWMLFIFVSMKNVAYVAKHGRQHQSTLAADAEAVFLALVTFCITAAFLSMTYGYALPIFAGLAVAGVRIFTDASPETYQLFTRRDAVSGVGLALAGLVVCEVFVLILL